MANVILTCPHDKRNALQRSVREAADRIVEDIERWNQDAVEKAYALLDVRPGQPWAHLDFIRDDKWSVAFVLKHPTVKIAFTEAACVEHRERGEHG